MEDYTKYSETSEETKDEIVTLTVNQDYHFDEPIDDNIIKEYGSHDVLIQNNGLYKQMYMTQSQYYCNGGDNNG